VQRPRGGSISFTAVFDAELVATSSSHAAVTPGQCAHALRDVDRRCTDGVTTASDGSTGRYGTDAYTPADDGSSCIPAAEAAAVNATHRRHAAAAAAAAAACKELQQRGSWSAAVSGQLRSRDAAPRPAETSSSPAASVADSGFVGQPGRVAALALQAISSGKRAKTRQAAEEAHAQPSSDAGAARVAARGSSAPDTRTAAAKGKGACEQARTGRTSSKESQRQQRQQTQVRTQTQTQSQAKSQTQSQTQVQEPTPQLVATQPETACASQDGAADAVGATTPAAPACPSQRSLNKFVLLRKTEMCRFFLRGLCKRSSGAAAFSHACSAHSAS
jgi:hypothetical protein